MAQTKQVNLLTAIAMTVIGMVCGLIFGMTIFAQKAYVRTLKVPTEQAADSVMTDTTALTVDTLMVDTAQQL